MRARYCQAELAPDEIVGVSPSAFVSTVARAVSDPRAAEILLRWSQRSRAEERVGDVDLDSMSERELERLHSGLVGLASLDETVLAALVDHMLADDKVASSS